MEYDQLIDFCHAELVGNCCRDSAMGLYGTDIAILLLCLGCAIGAFVGMRYGRQDGYREGRTDGFGNGVKAVQNNPDFPFASSQDREAFVTEAAAWRDAVLKDLRSLKAKSRS